MLAAVALAISGANLLVADDVPQPPSRQEIDELLAKADQKLATLQDALGAARKEIEPFAPDLWRNQADAARTAREMIKAIRANGPSGPGLMGLIATMDDASRGSLLAIIVAVDGRQLGLESRLRLASVTAAEVACYDASELIFHATFRLLRAEEYVINALVPAR